MKYALVALSFPLSLSSLLLILHFLSLPLFGLSLLLPALLLALSRSAPSFRLSPNALFTPLLGSSRIETSLCRVASGITMNLHSCASNSEHIAQL